MSHANHTVRGESARPVCVVTKVDDIRESLKGHGKPCHSRLLECRWDKSGPRRQTLLFFDSFDDDKECDRILIFIALDAVKSRHRGRNICQWDISDGIKTIATFTPCTPSWRHFIPNYLRDVAQRKGSNICKSVWCHQTFHKFIH